MFKEIIICITIVTTIIIGNNITQKYTTQAVEEMTNLLNGIRTEIFESKENIDINNIENEIDDINSEWERRHEKLAYYIEHDELEKVETNLTGLKGEIEAGEYGEAYSQIESKYLFI